MKLTTPRILHVCECLPGGPSSYLQEILPEQIEKFGRYNVGLLAPGPQIGTFREMRGLEIIATSSQGRNIFVLIRFAITIRREIRRFKPDVIHLHSTFSGGLGRLACFKLKNRPSIIYCAHGWIVDPDRKVKFRKFLGFIERSLMRLTDRIVNISPHETEFLKEFGIEGEKVQLILSGIKDRAPRALLPVLQDEALKIVFIGRLDRQKGFDLLLDAARHVSRKDAILVAIGDVIRGSERPSTDGIAIELTGWLPRDQVADIMASADAIVMPSRWEGLPLVALEAMRAGKAIIATRGGAFTYIIRDGENGVLIDPEDPQFLAKTLKTYSRDDFTEMGRAARRDFELKYLASRMSSELCELYDELVEKHV